MISKPISTFKQFVEQGYMVLPGAVPPSVLAEWAAWYQSRIECWESAHGRSLPKIVRLAPIIDFDVRDVLPKLWAAAGELLGGWDRIADPTPITDCFIVNTPVDGNGQGPSDTRAQWHAPTRESREWHIDGDWFRHYLDSAEWALVALVSWTDSHLRGGATLVAPGSHALVSRYLAQHPEGIDRFNFGCLLPPDFEFTQIEMKAGDVLLLHPHVLHCSSMNTLDSTRVVSSCVFSCREPLSLDGRRALSVVERAILRNLDCETISFVRTREPRYSVPNRSAEYAKSLRLERLAIRARLGG
jgi:hypothetical protein